MQPNLIKVCKQVGLLAKQTGGFLQRQQGKIKSSHVLTKSMNSFVTYVDKESEKRLVKGLKKFFPVADSLQKKKRLSIREKNIPG